MTNTNGGPPANQGGAVKRVQSGVYESPTHTIRGLYATWSGRGGSRITRWLVTEKATGRTKTYPTLSRAKDSLAEVSA
jgi:hypothetical protein